MTQHSSKRQRITLVRHGQTSSNLADACAPLSGWHDIELTDAGQREASLLAGWFSRLRPAPLVFSSSSRRAVATAALMLAPFDVGFTQRDDLREIHCGDLEGVPVADLEARYPDLWRANFSQRDDQFRWPGGESYAEFRARAVAALTSIAHEHEDPAIVLVTHAGFIAQIVGALHGTRPAEWGVWRPRNASVTSIEWAHEALSIVCYDQVDHLTTSHSERRSSPSIARATEKI